MLREHSVDIARRPQAPTAFDIVGSMPSAPRGSTAATDNAHPPPLLSFLPVLPGLLLVCILALSLLEFELVPLHDSDIVRAVLLAITLVSAALFLMRAIHHARFLTEIRTMLHQIHSGERTKRFYFHHAHGIYDRGLALAFSEAHKTLQRRYQAVVNERSSEEAIIASMAEGVLGVDLQERIIRINPAAAELLGVSPGEALGKTVHEVIRSAALQRFVRSVIKEEGVDQSEIELHGDRSRFLQMSGRELLSVEGEKIGVIVVLSDITRLRKLERARSDFIANVSHELKTPVTSIQGFAETLLDGALESPEDTRKFLGIISRQAERLGQIFDEMLVLSRLEQEEQIELEATELRPLLQSVVQSCQLRANSKQSAIEVECDSTLQALCHAQLLEQAIYNLVDNAVKYSPTGSTVRVVAQERHDKIVIAVKDDGPGIEPQHQSRIFERFYRVDKGRSRTEGGTGLGLAIVKHIAQAHGGQAWVDSVPGRGSIFSIALKSSVDSRSENADV
ncbi:MAG: PAS domain-containing protein [Proteobacteria bacterium]|nr:PAS domain-containing protein [Pseudomonadota bacterium]